MSDFWLNNPKDLWRFDFKNTAGIFNGISLIVIILTILSCLIVQSIKPFYVCVIIMAILGAIYYFFYDTEPFTQAKNGVPLQFPQQLPLRQPTPNNPFMNVPIGDYDAPQTTKDYQRYDDKPYPTKVDEEVREEVEDDFNKGLYQDANGRLWERHNSQRQYHSQPIGDVPNKAVEFGQWLYGVNSNCKENSIWMRYGVNLANNCTFSDISTCTNFGIKEPK